MWEVPVFYATGEGQTRRIAEHLAERIRNAGFRSSAIDLASHRAALFDWTEVRAVLLGASIHRSKHQAVAGAYVEAHRDQFNRRPSGFFSVSLAAASKNAAELAAASELAHAFPAKARWTPRWIVSLAGRLAYTKYGFFKRLLMRRIAASEGASTDTSRDHEYTDWQAVDRLADDVTAELSARRVKKPAPAMAV
jgi:menaquinone-dependent protoporphyrinogen oxidase